MLTLGDVRKTLSELEDKTADDLETEELEFKLWEDDPKALARTLREAVVCLANHKGGAIVVGVRDRVRGRKQAIAGVGVYNPMSLKKAIHDGTQPSILVELEEIVEPEGSLLLIHVPRGMPPHTTSDGVAKIRVGKECRALTGQMMARLMLAGGQVDPSEQILDELPADLSWVDPAALADLREHLKNRPDASPLAAAPTDEILEGLSLAQDGRPKMAALLLIGRAEWIKKFTPQHGVIFVRYRGETEVERGAHLKGPLFEILKKARDWVELHRRMTTIRGDGMEHVEIPNMDWETVREGLLNSICHRDYFQRRPITVSLRKDRLEIESPGGFMGGITNDNILRHGPVHRNELLGRVFVAAGLVEQLGVGVDRIFLELLQNGKGFPIYESDESFVRLGLPFEIHAEFVKLVRQQGHGVSLELNDLILLNALRTRPFLDRWSASEILGRNEDEAARKLAELRERGLFASKGRGRGTAYVYAQDFRLAILGKAARDRMEMMDPDVVKARVKDILQKKGKLTNREVRAFSGYSAMGIYKIFKALEGESFLKFEGLGRSAHVALIEKNLNSTSSGKRRK